MKPFMYHRQGLAQKYCQGLMGGVFRDYRSGLFLAAPRRTGKTTFLREDLLPTLEQNGFLPVYADLWADRTRDPSGVISKAIQEKLRAFSNFFEKIGAENFTFHGLEFNLKAPTLSPDITLGTALRTLTEVAKKPIALVVDEAQHALSTGKGTNAMFALKSARDTLNGAGQPTKLAVVFTGSNRDKLASLTLDHKQPFYGVTVQRFPIDMNPLPETKKGRYSLPFSSSFDCKNSPHPGTAWVRCSKPVTVLKWMKTGASGFS